jgi:hypothetical protein
LSCRLGPKSAKWQEPQQKPGLPDGLFSYQKFQAGKILEGFGMENVGTSYEQLEYFTAIWYNSWPFGIICGLVCLDREKSGNPGRCSSQAV